MIAVLMVPYLLIATPDNATVLPIKRWPGRHSLYFDVCEPAKSETQKMNRQRWEVPADGEAGLIVPLQNAHGNSSALNFSGLCMTFVGNDLTIKQCTFSNATAAKPLPEQVWTRNPSAGGSFSLQTSATRCNEGPRCCLSGSFQNYHEKLEGTMVYVDGCDCPYCKDQRFMYNNETKQLYSNMSALCVTAPAARS